MRRWGALAVALALASLVGGPVWVGFTGIGAPPPAALVAAIVLLVSIAWLAAPALEPVSSFLAGRPWHTIAGATAVVFAATASIQLALFMHNPAHRAWSAQPESDFYLAHSCLTGSTEGVHRAWRGENVYRVSSVPQIVAGRFEADPIMYSPPFLVLPAAMMLVTDDFIALQRFWFAFQAVTTVVALLLLAMFIGGELGARAAWAIPFFAVVPPLLLNLQIGNVQITVLAAAMTGMVLLYSGWPRVGAALLAIAIVAKLFPAVLVAYLLGQRQWRWTIWTGAWCAALTVIGIGLFGLQPIRDYLAALPAIMNGSTAATTPWTDNLWLAPSNQSIYGATRKLVALGVNRVTPGIEGAIQATYGMAVMLFAVLVGAITRAPQTDDRSRLGQAIAWLALLNLASFRSPFLPDAYAYVGSLWLVTLLLASRRQFSWREALALTAAWALLTPIYGGRAVAPQPFKLFVAITLLTQGLVIAATIGAVWMECRASVAADRALTRLPPPFERLPA